MPKLKRRRASKDALAAKSSETKTDKPDEDSPAAKGTASQATPQVQRPPRSGRNATKESAGGGENGSDFGAGILDSGVSSNESQPLPSRNRPATSSESPNYAVVRPWASMRITARSVASSVPTTVAS